MGCSSYQGSVGWFTHSYPESDTFEFYAFDPDLQFIQSFSHHAEVKFHNVGAWIKDGAMKLKDGVLGS